MENILKGAQDGKRLFTEPEAKEFDAHKNSIERADNAATIGELEQQRAALKRPQGALREVGKPPAVSGGKERKFSLRNVMRALSGDANVDVGYEKEVHAELSRYRQKSPEGFLIPIRLS